MNWHIVTGEYPPQPGGVSDYTRVVANGLVASGDKVHVWAPAMAARELPDEGVSVHRLLGGFGIAGLRRLDAGLRAVGSGRLLIQYVPQAFGWKGMNLPFCWWLYGRRRQAPVVMFHEVMYPLERGYPLRHNLLGAISCLMAAIIARAAGRILVSAPIWQEILRTRVRSRRSSEWLPLPTTVPVLSDAAGVSKLRRRYGGEEILLGHFSSYPVTTRRRLREVIPRVLSLNAKLALLLIGSESEAFRAELIAAAPALASRVGASGHLTLDDLSRHISACDLMVQPYPDGACARRTTLIAAIAHGRAIVTDTGRATEPFWRESGAVTIVAQGGEHEISAQIAELSADPTARSRYANAAALLYRERFELRHTLAILRRGQCASR